MANIIQASNIGDSELVKLCIGGDHQACRSLIERYQYLICAVTYAGCGDVHQSEDLAQETFLQAWKNMRDLKEPNRLKTWLCGIARNLTRNAHRKQSRGSCVVGELDEQVPDTLSPTPPEIIISQEEQALLWQNLARLPEEYREPMVLYYRHEESVAFVASALEISEEAVRQRLVRGRAMLAERIESLIDRGLRTSGPTKAFTIAAIAAIPGFVTSANAATLTATAGKGVASAKATSIGASTSFLLGPLIGLAGGYVGYRLGLAQTIAPQERRFMRRYFVAIVLIAAAFTLVMLGSMQWTGMFGFGPAGRAAAIVALAVAYAMAILLSCFWYQRRMQLIRARITAGNPQMIQKAQAASARWNIEYRSRWTLLGLPLVHINMGGSPDSRAAVAKGWIAIGAKAYGGLFACGGLAVAPLSFGGLAVGLLSWGGFAAGVLVWGGFALGVGAIGGVACGLKAIGGCALGWSAACGAIAVAGDFAQGIVVSASHANDPAAEAFFQADRFFAMARAFLQHSQWVWLLALVPVLPVAIRALQNRLTAGSGK